ncbi:MAG TPA: hypothetical protein V6D47_11160 [Oscillatoriaceae cyanobacterium]
MQEFWRKLFENAPELPPEPVAEPEEVPEIDWMAEYLRELGLSQSGGAFGQPSPVRKEYSSAVGFEPGMVPPDFETYQALLHRVFDPPKRKLCAQAAAQPMFRAAFEAWNSGDRQANLNILYEVYGKLSSLLGAIYRFHPAPLGYDPKIGNFLGLYVLDSRRIVLSERLLALPPGEMFDLIVHEQIHKLQHEMDLRLRHPSKFPLSLEERSLALYWQREAPRISAMYARGLNDISQGRHDANYRRIGIEYHAYDTGEAVADHLARAFA